MESTKDIKKEEERRNEESSAVTTTATDKRQQQSLLLLDSLRKATNLSEQEQCFTNLIKYMETIVNK